MSRGRYTVNEVEERTKVPASTLRQWERRYGFPKPERSGSGYRLYCDGDVRNIEQMKRHIAQGVSASRAAALLCRDASAALPGSVRGLQKALVNALLSFDEAKADEIFSQAYSLHGVDTVLTDLAQFTAAELGVLRRHGEVPVTTERFATAYLEGRLRSLLSATVNCVAGAVVVAACAPLEHDEIGALVLTTLLRRAGHRVVYLGANTPVGGLRELTQTLRPLGVMVLASSAQAATLLGEARNHLVELAPVLVFGGAAFNQRPDLAEALTGTLLEPEAQSAVRQFSRLIEQHGALSA